VAHRLFRESCYKHKDTYIKVKHSHVILYGDTTDKRPIVQDLSQLGRPIAETIIIDNSPGGYLFHPNNAIPVSSWFNDPHDTELIDFCPFLTDLAMVDDVRVALDGSL